MQAEGPGRQSSETRNSYAAGLSVLLSLQQNFSITLDNMVTYEIVGVVNFIKLSTFSLPIRIIFVKSIPKLFSIKYFTTLLL